MVAGVIIMLSRDGKGLSGAFNGINKWALIGTSTLLCFICTASVCCVCVRMCVLELAAPCEGH